MKKNIVRIMILVIATTGVLALSGKKVTLIINGEKKVVYTFAKDYKELLEHSTYYSDGDTISVALDSKVVRNTIVTIKKFENVTIEVDNKIIEHKTNKNTWEEVLQEVGITLNSEDICSLDIKSKVKPMDIMKIDRITVQNTEIIEEVPFNEEIVNDYKTEVGQTRLLSEGSKGKNKITYKITYKNGVEQSREKIKEEEAKGSEDMVIGKGTFDPNSLTVCVNQRRTLPAEFEPQDLVVPNVRMANSESRNMLRSEAAKALEKMFVDAEEQGIYLYAVSGYRSYYYQQSIYEPYSGYSAPPGASEHQLGLAMDVNTAYSGTNLSPSFGETAEGQWVKSNAYKYGFVIRYFEGSENITGYLYEPWHLRYLGVELATELKEKGITLEEYYGEH